MTTNPATVAVRQIVCRAIPPSAVRAAAHLTVPRSYGVYALPGDTHGTRRYRFGNHPVRQHELESQFGACRLLYLFLQRVDAAAVAAALNAGASMP